MEELIVRALQGSVSAEEEAKLRAWRNRAPENEALFQDFARLWNHLPDMEIEVETTVPSASHILERANSLKVIPLHRKDQTDRKDLSQRRGWWRVAAVAAMVATLFLAKDSLLRGIQEDPRELQIEQLATGAEETLMTTLSDGTIVYLAPNSALRVSPREGVREVWLEGRAFFGVAKHGPDWPFVVRSDRGEVQVLGTRFEFSTDGDEARVVVVEGRVDLVPSGGGEGEGSDRRVAVEAGQVGRAGSDGRMELLNTENIEALLSWMGNTLVFENTPLVAALPEIEAHFGAEIELRGELLGQQTVTGGFEDRNFAEVLSMICRVLDAACTISESSAVIATRVEAGAPASLAEVPVESGLTSPAVGEVVQ